MTGKEHEVRSFGQTLHKLAERAAMYDCIVAYSDPIVCKKGRVGEIRLDLLSLSYSLVSYS